jgi:hypothetical protein
MTITMIIVNIRIIRVNSIVANININKSSDRLLAMAAEQSSHKSTQYHFVDSLLESW